MPHYCWSARLSAAIWFLIASFLADHIGIHHAFILPVLCYVYIIFYALKSASARRQQPT
jgi:FHS family L-fucose permease-like MFS transporter